MTSEIFLEQVSENDCRKYVCPHCNHLLRDAVQISCGHRLCECCAKELVRTDPPRCPVQDCLDTENIYPYFPDHFIRKEIAKLSIKFKRDGCCWIEKAEELTPESGAFQPAELGAKVQENVTELSSSSSSVEEFMSKPVKEEGGGAEGYQYDNQQEMKDQHFCTAHDVQQLMEVYQGRYYPQALAKGAAQYADIDKLQADLYTQIASLKQQVAKLEKAVQSKSTKTEDSDFRLSLIENANYDGSMIWKIPQFSQRMEDARSGKYTSIFSLPFYSSRYGYKMCLRLYILGDGIGKSKHMSLFFVVMKGEFDAILQWPFTHKVSFRLINQHHGRDVVDVFQPDPMSSSFQRPKTDMNVASGCPRFISLAELNQGGFMEDNTVFIKVKVDTSTMKHI